MSVYKTEEGKNVVREACRSIYSSWPSTSTGRYLDTGEFGETYCREIGPLDSLPNGGAPLLLLHGSSSNSASWMGYAPLWAREFRVIAVDIPGQPGLSDEERPSVTDGSMRRWLESVVRALNVSSFFLCGMSLGSLIALEYSLYHGKRVKGLCLLTTAGIVAPRSDFFLRILPLLFMGRWGVKRINRIVHGSVPVDPGVEAFSLLTAKHYKQLREPLPLFSDAELSTLDVPLLYIGGTEDAMIDTRATAKRIENLLPHAEIDVLDGVGHVILDQGERIMEFLKRNL